MDITLEPTKQAIVNARGSYGFNCNTQLADTERILIEITDQVYDHQLNQWVNSPEKVKYQLEELQYRIGYGDNNNEVVFNNAIIRGFRKDGALRYRASYLPHNAHAEALAQIPDHYHDYARKAFQDEMAKLQNELAITISKGVVIK
jgi:uncharacterized Fe-S cluster-containing radical SAM superfamily protein